MRSTLLVLLALFLSAPLAHASSVCDEYRKNDPYLYDLVCTNGQASSKPAGANSTFSDAFNITSASLPTDPSSYGLETIGSMIRGGDGTVSPNFALIKGFHKFGTGISTSSNNTFYGNDVYRRENGTPLLKNFNAQEPAKGSFTNLNLGTSLEILRSRTGPTVRLGLSGRYNNITDSWGGGPGLMLNWTDFTIGAGYTRERVSNFYPMITFENLLVSYRIGNLEFEYTYLKNREGPSLAPIHIVTGTWNWKRLTLTVAARQTSYVSAGTVIQEHYALQYLFSKNFSAGFLYNFIPGANSVGIQIYL